jgi:formylmethanofuran dehydrogenase subunit E
MYEKLIDQTIACDLCGEKNPEGVIYKSDNFIYLCPVCLQKIEAAPESIKNGIERILTGNVL